MPNWCQNRLKVTGDSARLVEFDAKFKGRAALWPMAEFWFDGKSEAEVNEMLARHQREYDAMEMKHCFNALYPVPDEVLQVGYSSTKLRNKNESFRDLYNPDKWVDGYSWSIRHWGTKWDVWADVTAVIDGCAALYEFETAWSPPCRWLTKVCADWPDLAFELSYYEDGMGFAGNFLCSDGEVVRDDQFDGKAMQGFVLLEFGFDPYASDEECDP